MGIEPTEPAFRQIPLDLKSRPATRPDSPPHPRDCSRTEPRVGIRLTTDEPPSLPARAKNALEALIVDDEQDTRESLTVRSRGCESVVVTLRRTWGKCQILGNSVLARLTLRYREVIIGSVNGSTAVRSRWQAV